MIIVSEVYKSYKKPVLNGINFAAERGTIVGIAGENGSGKSTLLSIMVTLLRPDRGCVTLDGVDVLGKKFKIKDKFGFVPQDSALFDELTVAENINFWAAAYGKKYKSAFFTEIDLRKKVRELSGGMRKRLNIELALINEPDYLIMDEPTSALDIIYQEQVIELMKTLRDMGRGIIFTSHYADELWECDKLCVMNNGVFIFDDAPSNFSDREQFREQLYKKIDRSEYATHQ